MMNKAMTPTQVNVICCKLVPYVISFTNSFLFLLFILNATSRKLLQFASKIWPNLQTKCIFLPLDIWTRCKYFLVCGSGEKNDEKIRRQRRWETGPGRIPKVIQQERSHRDKTKSTDTHTHYCRFMGPKKKEDRRGSGSDVGGRRGSVEPSPSSRRGSVTKIQIGGHKE